MCPTFLSDDIIDHGTVHLLTCMTEEKNKSIRSINAPPSVSTRDSCDASCSFSPLLQKIKLN